MQAIWQAKMGNSKYLFAAGRDFKNNKTGSIEKEL